MYYLCIIKQEITDRAGFPEQKQIDMEALVNIISNQAVELLKSDIIKDMLRDCKTDEERQMKLAIASVYALSKAN